MKRIPKQKQAKKAKIHKYELTISCKKGSRKMNKFNTTKNIN